jgi:hypothetical protein
MSLKAIPLTVIPLLLYSLFVLFSGGGGEGETVDAAAAARTVLDAELFSIPMMSGAVFKFTWSDLLLVITLIVLFTELMKATYTSTASLIDHGLSMLVFIVALVLFLLNSKAATSTFFIILVALLIDVVAGFIIGIRVARRDIGLGAPDA